ncbi:MAG: type I secretion protein TolC [Betaproteobacteria bacterium HGW-Betaproteobacteria-9]|jgi:outer membrane protein|nr:MAG: type I secretion protein TolC [Betaproteobacteria bacterium HGW-Betaproteobacteria-9]
MFSLKQIRSSRRWIGASMGWMLVASAWGQNLQVFHDAALSNDAQWRAAGHALEAARQRPGQARAALLPQLSYVATRHDQRGTLYFADEAPTEKDVEARTRALQLTQGIIRPEQWMALRQANAQEAHALAQFEVARQQATVRIVQAYLDAWVAQESVRLVRSQLKAFEAQLELAQRNFKVGATTITDVHEAQAKRDLGLAQSIAAENELQARLTELERLTGRVPDAIHGLREDAPPPGSDAAALADWVERARQLQPEVLMAQAGLGIAETEQARYRAALLPTLDLTLKKGTDQSTGSVTAPTDVPYRNRTTQALLTLNWPIFEGGRSYYQMREAAASLDRAQAELDGAQSTATSTVRQSYMGLRSSSAQVKALMSARVSSLNALEASRVGYRIGTRINLDVLNAESQHVTVQRDLAKARADAVMHWVRLQAATGELSPEVVTQINDWLAPEGQAVAMDPAFSTAASTAMNQEKIQ